MNFAEEEKKLFSQSTIYKSVLVFEALSKILIHF